MKFIMLYVDKDLEYIEILTKAFEKDLTLSHKNISDLLAMAKWSSTRLKENDWQDISSAPRDGSEILLAGLISDPDDKNNTLSRVTAGFWIEPEPPIVGDCGGECRCPEYGDPEDPSWVHMHGGSDSGWMSSDGGFTTEWPALYWKHLPEWNNDV
jgi:hypothetical protein